MVCLVLIDMISQNIVWHTIPVIRRAVKTSGRALKSRIHQPWEAIASSGVKNVPWQPGWTHPPSQRPYIVILGQFCDAFVAGYWYLVMFDLHLLPTGIIGGGGCRWAHHSWWKLVLELCLSAQQLYGRSPEFSWIWNILKCRFVCCLCLYEIPNAASKRHQNARGGNPPNSSIQTQSCFSLSLFPRFTLLLFMSLHCIG